MFGNCQRPVFSLGVFHHKHRITSLCKFGLNMVIEVARKWWKKKHPWTNLCAFKWNKRLLARSLFIIIVRNYLFFKNYNTSEGVVSHNVIYYTNSSPMIVTKSVFKFIFVSSNYQTCILPFKSIFINEPLINHWQAASWC